MHRECLWIPARIMSARQPRQASPTSDYDNLATEPALSRPLTRESRRRHAWLKARAQYARDQLARQSSSSPIMRPCFAPHASPKRNVMDSGPKRKHSAFVKEEELQCLVEDQVGTPHISEIQADDLVSSELDVEELSVVGEVAAVDTAHVPDQLDHSGKKQLTHSWLQNSYDSQLPKTSP